MLLLDCMYELITGVVSTHYPKVEITNKFVLTNSLVFSVTDEFGCRKKKHLC